MQLRQKGIGFGDSDGVSAINALFGISLRPYQMGCLLNADKLGLLMRPLTRPTLFVLWPT